MATRLRPPVDAGRNHILGPTDVRGGLGDLPADRRLGAAFHHGTRSMMSIVIATAAFGESPVLALATGGVISASPGAAIAGGRGLRARADQRMPAVEGPQEGRA